MANIYKNAGRRGMVRPGGAEPVVAETMQETLPEVEMEKPETEVPKQDLSGAAVLTNIRKAQKPKKKNASFYLTAANIDRLSAMAEQEGMSASELLDHILRNVFGN